MTAISSKVGSAVQSEYGWGAMWALPPVLINVARHYPAYRASIAPNLVIDWIDFVVFAAFAVVGLVAGVRLGVIENGGVD